jgi:GAF domain-containing protein
MSASVDSEQLMGLVVEKACTLLEVERCGLFLAETEAGGGLALHCRQARGLPEEYFRVIRLGPRESIAGLAIAEGQTLWTSDILADQRFRLTDATRALMATNNIRAILSAPVIAGGRAIGVVSVYRGAGVAFTPEEADLLSAFALQVGIAVENARLLAASQKSLYQIRALFEVSKALASSLDTETALDLIVHKAGELIGVAHCILWAREAGAPEAEEVRPRAQAGFDPAVLAGLAIPPGVGIVGRVIRERTPAWTSDLMSDPSVALPAALVGLFQAQGIGATLGVPVETGESFLGVLAIYGPRGSTFAEDETTLLWSFADMAAIALENARLVAADREKSQLEAMLALARAAADRILNPVNVMTLNAHMLAQDLPADHPGRRRIEPILESGRRIQRIVGQMNRIARYEAREFAPGLIALELEKVAEAEPPEAAPAETD